MFVYIVSQIIKNTYQLYISNVFCLYILSPKISPKLHVIKPHFTLNLDQYNKF